MTTIDHYINDIVMRAAAEAREEGSAVTEAHHLLLAIAAVEGTAAHGVLASAGLGRQAIRDALDREFERSLGVAGVSPGSYALPKPFRDPRDHPKPGASARLALERGFAAAQGKKDLRPAHLLIGVLSAGVGTVPRALALAGVDRADLMGRVEETLSRDTW